MVKNRRIGKFYVTYNSIDNLDIVFVLQKLEFVPTRVQYLYHEDRFEYIGISSKFKEIEKGGIIPVYEILVNKPASIVYVREVLNVYP